MSERQQFTTAREAYERLTTAGFDVSHAGVLHRHYVKEYPDGLLVTARVIIHAAGRLIADATLEPAVVHYRITAYPKI